MKKYFESVNRSYSFYNIICIGILLVSFFSILDINQLPTKILSSYKLELNLIIGIALILLILLKLLENNIFDLVEIPSINYLDGVFIVSMISIILYSITLFFIKEFYFYKLLSLGIFLLFSLVMINYRSKKYAKKIENKSKYESTLCDLKDLYYGELKDKKMILLEEKEVDYDLLKRDRIINFLFETIYKVNPNNSFVISLEGKWGSGKTTIINNVVKKLKQKDENDIITINEFDPWMYNNEKNLLINMLNVLIRNTGYNYDLLSTSKLIKSFSQLILGEAKNNFIKNIFSKDDIESIKLKINEYLELSGKKIVFFIDNIDRIEKENILILFKIIGNILDFKKIIYILSFDDNRVKKIFESDLNIDYSYLKKIIQLKIKVPQVDENVVRNLYQKSLENLLFFYKKEQINIKNYNSIINLMIKQGRDIRDFKNFINSFTNFYEINYLNEKDTLIIEYIKFFNFELYLSIFNNKKYFISHDLDYSEELYRYEFTQSKFNEEGKKYFESLFIIGNNEEYKYILSEIFPYVKKFKNNEFLKREGIFIDNEYYNITKYKRMCSLKYFDLYFTETSNEFLEISIIVEKFIKKLFLEKQMSNIVLELQTILKKQSLEYHREIFEKIQLYIDDLGEESKNNLLNILFDNIELIDDSFIPLTLNAKRRAELIMFELLSKISEQNFLKFMKKMKEEYKKIGVIEGILYWFENDHENISSINRREKYKELTNKIAEYIINNIDLYNDKYYMKKNIVSLYLLINKDKGLIEKYIDKVLNEKTIFRFLYDITSISIGEKINYYIGKNLMEEFYSKEKINNILKLSKAKTESEKFIIKVYEESKYKPDIEFSERGIYLDKEIEITL